MNAAAYHPGRNNSTPGDNGVVRPRPDELSTARCALECWQREFGGGKQDGPPERAFPSGWLGFALESRHSFRGRDRSHFGGDNLAPSLNRAILGITPKEDGI